jgi:DNA-binding NtrC family response regulator
MKARIMIVDDDEPLRAAVKEILTLDGYEMSEAGDVAGLRRAFDGPAPDAVILDLSLPDGNGLAVLPELKQKWPAAKVVILTGYGTMDAAREAYEQMEDVYFESKPFDAGLLKALLELALAGREVQSPKSKV